MTAIDLLRTALQWTDEGIAAIAEDMRSAPLTQPTADGGNHPLWILGHLALLEGGLPGQLLGPAAGPNPVEHWRPLFGTGTQPIADASRYPSFDEVLTQFRALRAANLRLLDDLGDGRLDDTPAAIPPGFEDAMSSIGKAFLLLSLHAMVHYGQIADARRVAGVPPLI